MRKTVIIIVLSLFITLGVCADAQNIVPAPTTTTRGVYRLVDEYIITNKSGKDIEDVYIWHQIKDSDSFYQTNGKMIIEGAKLGEKGEGYYEKPHVYFPKIEKGESVSFKAVVPLYNAKVKYLVDASKVQKDYSGFEDYAKYTKAEDKIPSDHQFIKYMADKIARDEENPYLKAKEFYNFVLNHIEYDSDQGNKGSMNALFRQKGVCEDYANLFVALCRASGIPARMVYGYINIGEFDETKKITQGHAWAEFYVKGAGWIFVEVTAGNKTTAFEPTSHPHVYRHNMEYDYFVVSYSNDPILYLSKTKGFDLGIQMNISIEPVSRQTQNN